MFCLLNNRDLTYTVDDAETLMLKAAAGHVDLQGISTWLSAHLTNAF